MDKYVWVIEKATNEKVAYGREQDVAYYGTENYRFEEIEFVYE